jgi:hypothetical protein
LRCVGAGEIGIVVKTAPIWRNIDEWLSELKRPFAL